MDGLPSLAQTHSIMFKCCSPICYIDYLRVNLEKTMLLDPRTLTVLIGGEKYILPPPSDLSGVQLYFLPRLLAMNLTLVTVDGGAGSPQRE